jgi:hypothetical protein
MSEEILNIEPNDQDREKVDNMIIASTGYWALMKKIKLQSGLFTTKGYEYQIKPLNSSARRKCYKKGAQTFGATEIETLDDLHGMIYGLYPLGVLHAFPTADAVEDFGKTRFNPLISANKTAIGKFVKTTDTARLKKVAGSFLYLRSARLSQKLGETDEDTGSQTAGFSVDKVVFDETEFMDLNVVEKFKGRMGKSLVKKEVYLGNPSNEDYGIDLIFASSDQQYWHRRCGCGTWTCAELSFPNCVKIRPNGTGYIGCDKCGKELPMWAGEGSSEWVAKFPEKSAYMEGYMASQLMSLEIDPAEILEDFTNPPNGNLADVYRLRLGMAYSSKDDKLKKSDVLANCTGELAPVSHQGPCAMGVDVGKIKHVVIGTRTGNDRYELLRAVKVESFNDIRDLARRYNVKSAVVDIRPYEDEARQFQKSERYKIFLCEYSDQMIQDSTFNEDTGTVKVHRTGIFDSSHRVLSRGQIKLPLQTPEVEEFARQCCNVAKFEEKDKRKGTIVYRYRPTGDQQEHFRNALNYFLLAASQGKIARISNYDIRPKIEVADNEYNRVAV